MTVKMIGIEAAQNALNDALKDVEIESELLLNVMLQGISRNTKPYVPVGETSNLINSEYFRTDMTPSGPVGEYGYSASYAKYVHEGPQKNWQKPGASNRFLELGIRDYINHDMRSDVARFQK